VRVFAEGDPVANKDLTKESIVLAGRIAFSQ
jgi:hypothetical protein